MTKVYALLALMLVFIPLPGMAQNAVGDEIKIGVLAKRGELMALERWQATAEYLQQQIPSRRFRIVPLDFDEIPPVVRNGLIDFLIVNPAIYVDLSVRYDIQRILTLENRLTNETSANRFGSVVFTRSDHAHIHSLADLRNQRLAAVHETSLGGWILSQHEMHRQGVERGDLRELHFSGTHDQVVRDVLSGSVDAGVVRTDTLERMAAEERIEIDKVRAMILPGEDGFPLRVSTQLVPEWPISKLRHVSNELADDVALALLRMQPHDPAALEARIVGWSIPENYQGVHEILETLGLPPYDQRESLQLWLVIKKHWYWVAIVVVVLLLQSGLIANVNRLNRRLRRQSELILERDGQLHSMFHQGGVGFAFISSTGAISQGNQRLLELCNRSEVELLGMNITDLVCVDDLSTATSLFEEMRRGHRDSFTQQLRIRAGDGKDMPWVLLTLSASRNDRGAIKFMAAVFDDISNLKQLELELETERRQKDLILNIAGDGILGLDTEGRHTFVNPAAARMLGYEVEDMLGRDSHAMWHHHHPDGTEFPAASCPITSVLKAGVIHRGTNEIFWTREGEPLHAEYISTPIREGGQITGAVVVFRETGESTE